MIVFDGETDVEEFTVWEHLESHIRVNKPIQIVSFQGTAIAEVEELEVAWEVSLIFTVTHLYEIELFPNDFLGSHANCFCLLDWHDI